MFDNNMQAMASAGVGGGRTGKAQPVGDGANPSSPSDPGLEAHRAAVANTLSWADESADRGDYVNALAWLNVLDAIRETLPEEYEGKRLDWRHALFEQHTLQCTA
jgi:hypothetical protein